MSIRDVDRPVDIDALAETFSGPGPYPWTAARDVRLACAELRSTRARLAKMGPVYEATIAWRQNERALDAHAVAGTEPPVTMRQADWQTIEDMRAAADAALPSPAVNGGDDE